MSALTRLELRAAPYLRAWRPGTVLAIADRLTPGQALGDIVERVARVWRDDRQAVWFESVYHTSLASFGSIVERSTRRAI
jgi:hypothetical protein